MKELRATMKRVASEQGNHFPEWVLDRIGTEVMVGNRIAMGPGLAPPRFRWASYVDALMLPLSTVAERTTPDNRVLYPLEERLLRRYLADLHLQQVPPTLDQYLRAVVTPTLERQRKEGCIAVKFEAAYLRKLDFDDASADVARRVYARYASGGTPTHAEYKTLQDYLFRQIAREAGRLGMAVHIHSYEGGGGFYRVAGGDPLLLEPAFNDSTLRGTHFVIVHGGGIFANQAGAMLGKPNVYLDMSALTLVHSPSTLAAILRGWLTQWPDRVPFGTDASPPARCRLGARGVDRDDHGEAGARDRTHRHDAGTARSPVARRGDRDDGDARECVEAVWTWPEAMTVCFTSRHLTAPLSSMLDHAPHFDATSAAQLARDLYGLDAKATALTSERDQNFLLETASGDRVVLKIANALEEPAMIDAQQQAMSHLAPVLDVVPRVIATRSGAIITAVVAPGDRHHLVWAVTHLPGVPLATVRRRTPALLEDFGRRIGALSQGLSDFDHPAIHRDFHWDLAKGRQVVGEHRSLIDDVARRDDRCAYRAIRS